MAWHVITCGGPSKPSNYMEFILDSASDINTPPTTYTCAPGSTAHTPGFDQIWEVDASGNWAEIGGD